MVILTKLHKFLLRAHSIPEASLVKESMLRLLDDVPIKRTNGVLRIGDIKFGNFVHMLRAGRIKEALTLANPRFKALKDDAAYINMLRRESKKFPDSKLYERSLVRDRLIRDVPELEKVTNAKELKSLVEQHTALDRLFTHLERSTRGKMKKRLAYIGGTMLISGGIYVALDDLASRNVGCFRYSKIGTEIIKCKIRNASCSDNRLSIVNNVFYCPDNSLPDTLQNTNLCADWDGELEKNSPCRACDIYADPSSKQYIDPSLLPENVTLQCVSEKSISLALADIVTEIGGTVWNTVENVAKETLNMSVRISKLFLPFAIMLAFVLCLWYLIRHILTQPYYSQPNVIYHKMNVHEEQ